MSLISPKFDVKLIIFTNFGQGPFPKIAGKSPDLSEKKTGKTQIKLFLQKQSDLGVPCLSRLLWQATTVRNFRPSTILHHLHMQYYELNGKTKLLYTQGKKNKNFECKLMYIFLFTNFNLCIGSQAFRLLFRVLTMCV